MQSCRTFIFNFKTRSALLVAVLENSPEVPTLAGEAAF